MTHEPGDTVFCEGTRWNYIGTITEISPLDISLENAVKVFDTPRQTEGDVMANGVRDASQCEFVGERCLSRAGMNVAKWDHEVPKCIEWFAGNSAIDYRADDDLETERQMMDATIANYKTALADTICAPMGVVPDSAEGLVGDIDLIEAEKRRIKNDA